MSGATVTADHAQTSDRTAASARRILAVAPVDHPGGAETGLLRLLARLGGVCGRLLPVLRAGAAQRVLHAHDIVTRVPAMWRRADLVFADSAAVAAALPGLRAEVVHVPVDPIRLPQPRPGIAVWVGPWSGSSAGSSRARARWTWFAPLRRSRRGAPGAQIVVIGGDPYGCDPVYLCAVTGSPEVEHHPWMENAAGVLRHLDMFVLPSHQEPFGTVLAEAMMVGTVVATQVGGLAEVVEDGVTGRLVAPGDPEALAAGVLDVLGRREAMSVAARTAARRFGADDYADRVERLITRTP